mmetsp:Transcript_68198/g.110650  ORF Transcript_68198/g.110650 Transcript_68198/m.110650 type:complete len:220 (+) Transcript_68198:1373-2032(+)
MDLTKLSESLTYCELLITRHICAEPAPRVYRALTLSAAVSALTFVFLHVSLRVCIASTFTCAYELHLPPPLSASPSPLTRASFFCCGYCATSQGSLDWFEVDLSARPASSSKEICVLHTAFCIPSVYCSLSLVAVSSAALSLAVLQAVLALSLTGLQAVSALSSPVLQSCIDISRIDGSFIDALLIGGALSLAAEQSLIDSSVIAKARIDASIFGAWSR